MSADTEQWEDDAGPSKSQLKRESNALQALGEQLTKLSPATLEKCALPGNLQAAIEEFHRIPPGKHGALRRHTQFIGRLMREVPEDILDNIRQQLDVNVHLEKKRFHDLETLRASLIAGSNDALTQLVADHPAVDIQQLRNLIRNARREAEQNQPPESARKLFRLLRELQQEQ
jgi:ribosome-associated protein